MRHLNFVDRFLVLLYSIIECQRSSVPIYPYIDPIYWKTLYYIDIFEKFHIYTFIALKNV